MLCLWSGWVKAQTPCGLGSEKIMLLSSFYLYLKLLPQTLIEIVKISDSGPLLCNQWFQAEKYRITISNSGLLS